MDKPKILWLSIDRGRRVFRINDQQRAACLQAMESAGWEVDVSLRKAPVVGIPAWIENARTDRRLCRRTLDMRIVNKNYDIVYVDPPGAYQKEDWTLCRIPKVAEIEDVHGYINKLVINFYNFHNFFFFVRYRSGIQRLWNRLPNWYWYPWAVDTSMFHSYRSWDKRENKILLTGRFSRASYPTRWKVYRKLRLEPWFLQIDRPNDIKTGDSEPREANYAKLLSSIKIAIATATGQKYTVMKYFEIPACGTAMLAQNAPFKDLRDLGFKMGKHFLCLEPQSRTLSIDLEKLLQEDNLLQDVACNSLDLITSRHTVQHRANIWLEYIESILNKS